jgi:8-oxoguanine deaminase
VASADFRTGRTLLTGFDLVATFDDDDRLLPGGDILVDGPVIAGLGVGLDAEGADRVIDCRGLVALPGLINAHHHLYQGGFRAVPALERALIGPWLAGLGALVKQRWQAGHFGPDVVEAVATAVLAESLLGGQTTVADQHYFFPVGVSLPYVEATAAAAAQVGVRLHACRGSITDGPDPDVTQGIDEVLRHSSTLIDDLHDPRPGAMVRVALAPCGVHVDQRTLFDELAALAADHDAVRLHTHLYEKVDVEACRVRYGCSPWQLLVEHGWAQPRTWLAHVVDPPAREIAEMAEAGVAVAHLPAPDLKMGWGPAPLRDMLDAGVIVGAGTTGSASNDGGDLLGDLRLAALVQRSRDPDDPMRWPSAAELLRMATRGSASCLGRGDIGVLTVGARADIAAWDQRGVDRVGVHDPLAGLLLTGLGSQATLVLVGGRVLVEDGHLTALDPHQVAARARALLGV